MTHIQKRRNAATACMLEVMDILEWDWKKYCYYKYEMGLLYIHIITGCDPYISDQIARSKRFWNWWKIHWTLREEDFLSELKEVDLMYHIETRRHMYAALHDPGELINGVCNYRYALENDYAKMINEIQHEHR